MVLPPNNYTQYTDMMFQENMTGWDFASNGVTVLTHFIPPDIFWMVVLLLPFMSMWTRQGTFAYIGILYLLCGFVVASKMPPMFATLAFWFFILGLGGTMYGVIFKD